MATSTCKAAALAAWESLPENLPVLPHFEPIPYKASGSRYGACGIRIDGTPAFIDAVLSRLKDLIDAENGSTRLELARSTVERKPDGKPFPNREEGAEVCYVRRHMRGPYGRAIARMAKSRDAFAELEAREERCEAVGA